jgi:trimethylamine--corrinoid protein Co-methyltransferase
MMQQPLAPLHADLAVEPFRSDELDHLLEASLRLLETTGVMVHSSSARDTLMESGAPSDDLDIVRLPPDLVLDAVQNAPRHFVLASRDGTHDLDLSSGASYACGEGCGSEVADWHTGLRRPSTKQDLADISRVQDYLGSIGLWWPMVAARDRGAASQLHELDAGWNNTVKHVQGFVQGEQRARLAVEMARVIAGGEDELRARPVLSNLIGTVSPLVLDADGMDAALVFAAAGVPVCFCSMPTLGTTAPASKGGAIVLALAEILAATAVVQLAYPGAPIIGSIEQVWADPGTGKTITMPLDWRGSLLPTRLLHHVGLPAFWMQGGTDATTADAWQAAAELMLQFAYAALDGAEIVLGFGLTDCYTVFSVEKMLLDDDLYHRARYACMDLALDRDSLALDVIEAVGPGGHFLAQRHTRNAMRASFSPTVAHQLTESRDYRPAVDVARARGLEILEDYQAVALAAGQAEALAEILADADSELAG